MLAALKRLVNGYSVSPAKLIMDDDDDQSVDMDELVFRPNPVERLELSNCLGRRGGLDGERSLGVSSISRY